jgi:nucleoside-diphosphate-sugar epimerase
MLFPLRVLVLHVTSIHARVRYPSILGLGIRTPGMGNYISWVIEERAKGKPFTIWITPETTVPILYFKDAARAIVQLSEAPRSWIQMVNYLRARR